MNSILKQRAGLHDKKALYMIVHLQEDISVIIEGAALCPNPQRHVAWILTVAMISSWQYRLSDLNTYVNQLPTISLC